MTPEDRLERLRYALERAILLGDRVAEAVARGRLCAGCPLPHGNCSDCIPTVTRGTR